MVLNAVNVNVVNAIEINLGLHLIHVVMSPGDVRPDGTHLILA